MIAGNDIHRARHPFTFKERKSALGDGLRDAVVVENVTGNEHEVDLMLDRFSPQLLDGLEAGFTDPLAGALLEARDPQAQMKVGGVQETYHTVISRPAQAERNFSGFLVEQLGELYAV